MTAYHQLQSQYTMSQMRSSLCQAANQPITERRPWFIETYQCYREMSDEGRAQLDAVMLYLCDALKARNPRVGWGPVQTMQLLGALVGCGFLGKKQ